MDTAALVLVLIACCAFVAIALLLVSNPGAVMFCVGTVAAIIVLVYTFRALDRHPNGSGLQTVLWGIAWLVVACWFWGYEFGNPVHELALIRSAGSVTGSVVEASEEPPEESKPWTWSLAYKYRLADGREFAAEQHGDGRLPEEFFALPHAVEIEYVPYKPTISRIKGTGHQDVPHWLTFSVIGGCILLLIFVWPGVHLIQNGVRDLRHPPSRCGK